MVFYALRAKMPHCYNLAVSSCTRMAIHFVHVDRHTTQALLKWDQAWASACRNRLDDGFACWVHVALHRVQSKLEVYFRVQRESPPRRSYMCLTGRLIFSISTKLGRHLLLLMSAHTSSLHVHRTNCCSTSQRVSRDRVKAEQMAVFFERSKSGLRFLVA